jgi:hypothetical protein
MMLDQHPDLCGILDVSEVLQLTKPQNLKNGTDEYPSCRALSVAGLGPKLSLKTLNMFSNIVILNLSNMMLGETSTSFLKDVRLDHL